MAGSRAARLPSNRLLAALPPAEARMIASIADEARLAGGELVCGQGAAVDHVYFPRRGAISLYSSAEGTVDVGIGLIGREGMFGLAAIAGSAGSPMLAVTQGEFVADRVGTPAFLEMLARSPALSSALMVYCHTFASQMGQNTACVTRHPARERLARWMLDVSAACDADVFVAKQSAMASALGIQRPAVSGAASELQRLGLISYRRGAVEILDRPALKSQSCDCTLRPPGPRR